MLTTVHFKWSFSVTYPETRAALVRKLPRDFGESAQMRTGKFLCEYSKSTPSLSFSLLWNHARSSLDSFMWSHRSADRLSLELSWWRPLHPTHDSNALCRLWMNGRSQRLDNSDFSFLTPIIGLKTPWRSWSQWAHCDVRSFGVKCPGIKLSKTFQI